MPILDNVPQEMFDNIISHLKEEDDSYDDWRELWQTSRALREVNRILKEKVTPTVFECATLWLSEQSFEDFAQLSCHPEL